MTRDKSDGEDRVLPPSLGASHTDLSDYEGTDVRNLDLIRRREFVMGLIEPEVQKERLVRMLLLVQPADRIVHDQLTGIAFQRADSLAVAKEVDGILVAGLGAI